MLSQDMIAIGDYPAKAPQRDDNDVDDNIAGGGDDDNDDDDGLGSPLMSRSWCMRAWEAGEP